MLIYTVLVSCQIMGSIRQVVPRDIEQIYDICVKVELKPQNVQGKDGFLLTAYSSHLEMKNHLLMQIGQSYFYSYTENKKLLGFVLAYSGRRWKEMMPAWGDPISGNIEWSSKSLAHMGIMDISSILKSMNFAVLEKIAVDPIARGRGIAPRLCTRLFEELRKDRLAYVFVEIIKNVFDRGKPLGISNEKSMRVFSNMGAEVVGTSKKPYSFANSVLGERASFSDWVYAIAL